MFDNVTKPSHYLAASVTVQPIELTARLDACLGQALNYVMRAKHKGNETEDLLKAVFYLRKSMDIGQSWDRYRNRDGAVYVLAKIFHDNTDDELTKEVLSCLFLREEGLPTLFSRPQDDAVTVIGRYIEAHADKVK